MSFSENLAEHNWNTKNPLISAQIPRVHRKSWKNPPFPDTISKDIKVGTPKHHNVHDMVYIYIYVVCSYDLQPQSIFKVHIISIYNFMCIYNYMCIYIINCTYARYLDVQAS